MLSRIGDAMPKSATSRDAARDRKRTEHDIIHAIGTLLARDGFRGLGVNALAREAGIDKVLIYRYFGGLDAAVEAYANEVEFWPTADELAGYHDDLLLNAPLADRIIAYLKNLARALHRRPSTLAILAWEMAEQNDLTDQLDGVRRRVTEEFVERFITPALASPSDVRGALELLSMGVIAAVVRSRHAQVLRLSGGEDAEDWSAIDRVIEKVGSGLAGQLDEAG